MEIVVALMILQVGLLGVLGIFTLASSRLTRAMLLERAVAEVAAVADSLSAGGAARDGESIRGPWRVSWTGDSTGVVVRAELLERRGDGPFVQVDIP